MTDPASPSDGPLFYVVGNGPSLTTDILDKLPENRWIGMNAAYKYWERTGRYPHYYSCLDPVVVVQHADAIQRMMGEGKIAEFFLHEAILDVAPDLAHHPKVTLLRDFLARKTHTVPVSKLSAYKQTTGVLATRFCIEKGHHDLCLLGIDCSYVEELPETLSGPGYELTIGKTVNSNPNYFFDNYQEKGEKYQVPNPAVHSGNLHLQSFIALRQDIIASGHPIRILVGSRRSHLSRFSLFPDFDVRAHLGLRRLQAVGVPLIPHELDVFLEQLDLWIDPKFQPAFEQVRGVVLHLFLSCGYRADIEARVRAAVSQRPWLKHWFERVRISFLDLPPAMDFYIKGSSPNVFSNKSGPNIFFLAMMAACRDYAHTMLMEADCLPVRPGWLAALERATCDAPPGSWVIGANYAGPTLTAEVNAYHTNGNAIYATGDRAFQTYLEGDFLTALQWLTEHVSPSLAYDVAFATGMNTYKSVLKGCGVDLRKYAHRYVLTPVIANLGGTEELEPGKCDIIAEVVGNPDLYVGHGIPFQRALEQRQDDMPSFYAGDLRTISELRPHSFASVPEDARWTNLGYGRLTGALTGGRSAAGQSLQMQFRAEVAKTWGRGDFVARLILPPGTALTTCEVKARHARKGTLSVPSQLSQDPQGRLRIVTNATEMPQDGITQLLFSLQMTLPAGLDQVELQGLRVLFRPYPERALDVVVTPENPAVRAITRSWGDWLARGQAALDRKYGFLTGNGIGRARPVLRPLTARPKAEYDRGALILPLTGKSTAKVAVDLSGILLAGTMPEAELTLHADTFCTIEIGCGTAATALRLAPGQSATSRLPIGPDTKEVTVTLQQTEGGTGRLTLETMRFPGTSTAPQFDRVVSINPDAESFFGHFLNYEVRLGRAMAATGVEHIIAGPVDAEPRVYEAHPEMVRVFSGRTNKLYSRAPGGALPDLPAFRDELSSYVAGLRGKTLLFMYCGSPEIAEVLHDLAQAHEGCTFAVSLYYLSWMDLGDAATQAYWKPRLQRIAAHPRMRLIVPSPELKQELATLYGITAEELPHPSTTFDDAEVAALRPDPDARPQTPPTVVFPGNMRGGKGYELTAGALTALIRESSPADLRIRLRHPPADSVNKARRDFFDSIRHRVDITDSYLEEEEFRALLVSADLVVIPYTKDRFANRTSGLLIDSLLLGKPCIAIEDTWLSRTVDSYDFGLVAAENGEALAEQILAALAQLDSLRAAALQARDRYTADNSWQALARFLVLPVQKPAQAPPVTPLAAPGQGESKVQRKKALIIGNGPSARLLATAGFDLIPDDMDTFGTTAAFRFYEDIGWWPTYYALADRKVVYHHRETFARLMADPSVTTRKFYLSWKVSDSPKMELIPHSSTGSFSLKKAIEMGYEEIYLIGMEGAYVEEILESRPLTPDEIAERGFGVLNLTRAESKLRIITNTPSYNPNYFFAGYQQKGDVYSLPQANTHQANWNSVTEVMQATGARVINLSQISKIDAFERGDIRKVFPELPETCWDDLSDPFEDRLRMAKSHFEIEAGPAYRPQGENRWLYRSGGQEGHLRALFRHPGKTAGRRLVGGLSVTASHPVTVEFGLGRHGHKTPYEGKGMRVTLQPGIPTLLEVAPEFAQDHGELKLQLTVVDAGNAVEIAFDLSGVYLVEGGASVCSRFTGAEMNYRRGERAAHEGDLSLALAIFLRLSMESDIGFIRKRALEIAEQIGIPQVSDLETLNTRLHGIAPPKDGPATSTVAQLRALLQDREEIAASFEAISQGGKWLSAVGGRKARKASFSVLEEELDQLAGRLRELLQKTG